MLKILYLSCVRSAVFRVVTTSEGFRTKKNIPTLHKRWCRDIFVLFFTTYPYLPKGTAAILNDVVIYIRISKLIYKVAEISCHIWFQVTTTTPRPAPPPYRFQIQSLSYLSVENGITTENLLTSAKTKRYFKHLGISLLQFQTDIYRSADKSLAWPGRKRATATEDFDVHISYLLSQLEKY